RAERPAAQPGIALDEARHRLAAELAELAPEIRIGGALAQRRAPQVRMFEHELEIAAHGALDDVAERRVRVAVVELAAALCAAHLGDGEEVLVLVGEAQVERADR